MFKFHKCLFLGTKFELHMLILRNIVLNVWLRHLANDLKKQLVVELNEAIVAKLYVNTNSLTCLKKLYW